MFVDIVNPKSPLAVENLLAPYKKGCVIKGVRQPKEKITPEVCFEILKSSNYARNIKDMLQCIADLPIEEQAAFEKIVLATFDRREQPEAVVKLGEKLAQTSRYVNFLAEMRRFSDGDLIASAAQPKSLYVTSEDALINFLLFYQGSLPQLADYDRFLCLSELGIDMPSEIQFPKVIDCPNASAVYFAWSDMTGVQKILAHDNAVIDLENAQNLPDNLEIPHAAEIRIDDKSKYVFKNWKCPDGALHYKSLRANFKSLHDFSMFGGVSFLHCTFDGGAEIVVRDGAKVDVIGHAPMKLDYSQCAEVSFTDCGIDLLNLDKLQFRDGAVVSFNGRVTVPENADFSHCAKVIRTITLPEQMDTLDCSLYDEIHFKGDQAEIFFSDAKNPRLKNNVKLYCENVWSVPHDVDFSACWEFYFKNGNLGDVDALHFRNGAKVTFENVEFLPDVIDVADCDEVCFNNLCSLKVKELHFKNGAKVHFERVYDLPHDMDFSMCDEVTLIACDLSHQHNLRFKNGAKVRLSSTKILSAGLDVSRCDKVNLMVKDLSNQHNLRFKDGAGVKMLWCEKFPPNLDFSRCAMVDLYGSKNLPQELDFSNASYVCLNSCDLSQVKKLVFGKDTQVLLKSGSKLPPKLDFSSCGPVNLEDTDFRNVTQVIFKNREQMEKSKVRIFDEWNVQVVFADEQPHSDVTNAVAIAALNTKNGRAR